MVENISTMPVAVQAAQPSPVPASNTLNVKTEEDGKEVPPMPETWDELKQSDELLKTIPDLTTPERLLPAQSIGLMNVGQFCDQQRDEMQGKDEYEVGVRMQAIVTMADDWLMDIAVNPAEFDEWRRGLPPMGAFGAYLLLLRWYSDRLGKYTRSRIGSKNARSN